MEQRKWNQIREDKKERKGFSIRIGVGYRIEKKDFKNWVRWVSRIKSELKC